jgi:hypothetical protein
MTEADAQIEKNNAPTTATDITLSFFMVINVSDFVRQK